LKLQSYSTKYILALPIFSKFQLWSQTWQQIPKFFEKFVLCVDLEAAFKNSTVQTN
jgi:hypothetical protein